MHFLEIAKMLFSQNKRIFSYLNDYFLYVIIPIKEDEDMYIYVE